MTDATPIEREDLAAQYARDLRSEYEFHMRERLGPLGRYPVTCLSAGIFVPSGTDDTTRARKLRPQLAPVV